MEESEKRRERLQAMRMEAARTGVNDDSQSFGLPSHGLSNPLIESEVASPTAMQYRSPRFDFYTDPMSAFSASKRANTFAPQISQGYHGTHPRPNYPVMASSPAYQNLPGVHHDHSLSHGRLVEAAGPLGSTASTWGGSGYSFNYSESPYNSRGGNFTNSGFRPGNSPHAMQGRGRGGMYSNSAHIQHYDSGDGSSHYPDSRRGRGGIPGRNLNTGSGPYGRRGTVSHKEISAEARPDLYYKKEMLEDPWKSLSPTVWKVRNFDKSWLPKSISVKKARIPASETPHESVSQQSLAEFLSTSFNETVDEPDS